MTNVSELVRLENSKIGNTITLLSSVDSTNNYIKNLSDVLSDGHVVVACEQLSGRGRQGKSFYSPGEDGLYMSVLVKDAKTTNSDLLTARGCLSVCRAIEKLGGFEKTKLEIKWVNDIYCKGKKLAGILCERRAMSKDDACIIIGIGVNLKIDRATLPKELRSIATSIYDVSHKTCDALTLCALVCEQLQKELYENNDMDFALAEYKKRSMVIGKEITIIQDGVYTKAKALDVLGDGALLVEYEDKSERKLYGGEISIKLK